VNPKDSSISINKELKKAFHEKCVREGITMKVKVAEMVVAWVKG
jgi:hypothetical protein